MKRRRISSSRVKAHQSKRGRCASTRKPHVKHALQSAKQFVELLLLLQKLDWDKLMQMFKWWDE